MDARLPANAVIEALATGRPAWGTWVQTGSQEACEAAAAVGFDFVLIDLQHGSTSIPVAAGMIARALRHGASPIVRLPDVSTGFVGHLLDAGAHGVLVPDLRTADQARAVVAAAAFHPQGKRGACRTIVATGHGAIPWDDYADWTRTGIVTWGLIETVDALGEIADIAASGLDGLMLGAMDLAVDMGLGAQPNHPDVVAALKLAMNACAVAQIECIAAVSRPEDALEWISQGVRIVAVASDRRVLTHSWDAMLQDLNRLPRTGSS